MTDNVTPQPAPRPVEPPAGPEVLSTTAEWNVAALPWITPDELLEPSAAPSGNAPSENVRSGNATPPARSQGFGRNGAFVAGAGAPGGAERTTEPLITRPKQRQPELDVKPAVLIAPDLGATLPPRAQRQPALLKGRVQGTTPVPPALAPLVRRYRLSFVALGAAVGCTLGYAVWGAVLHPAAGDAAPRELPKFLQEAAPTASASSGASAPDRLPTPPPSEATFVPVLASDPNQGTPTGADAGTPPASTSLAEETPSPSPEPVSPQSIQRADVVKASPSAPAGPRRQVGARPLGGAKTRAQSSRREPVVRAEPRAPRPTVTAAVRPLTTYIFADKALFAVATAPMRVTDLVLERGEKLVSQPTAGDAARWVITVVPTTAQSHVFVKPLRARLRTNLTLTTDRRTYFLELSSSEDGSYMAGVEWSYPSDDAARQREALARAERERQSLTAVSDLQALRFDYEIRATPGARSWTPNLVFDDGVKTFIRFPQPIAPAHAPILLISRSGTTRDAKYVNYRIKGELYVVDRLIDAAELRRPSDDDGQDIVRIIRRH